MGLFKKFAKTVSPVAMIAGGGGGDILGGITGSTAAKAAKQAGREQARAMERALKFQERAIPLARKDIERGAKVARKDIERAYKVARREFDPYAEVGPEAMQRLQALTGEALPTYTPAEYRAPTAAELEASPAVQFRMQQAQRALERGAAAKGGLFGGGHQRQLARYMQDLASQEYEAETQRRFREAQLAEEQARFAPQFALTAAGQRARELQALGQVGYLATGEQAGLRERLGAGLAGIRERLGTGLGQYRMGLGAAQAATTQAAGQARASGALAASQARQQALGNIMQLGGTLGAAYLTGGGSLLGGIGGGAGGGAAMGTLGGGGLPAAGLGYTPSILGGL